MQQLKWIDSIGDLFLLISEKQRNNWSGIANRNAWKNGIAEIAEDFRDAQQSDYGAACDVPGHFGVVELEGGQALVLANVQASAAYFSREENEFFIVRWMYAPDQHHVSAVLETFMPGETNAWIYETDFTFDSATCYLFDPGLTWQKLQELHEDFLELRVMPGMYKISTMDYMPDDETHLLVHRFERTPAM
jgi:hypothetical protein